ncbi:putative (E,E)-alpha-farnesene synthase-like [Capsicum annuum]|nr:putative (E,E)-alpha-farnesene synthase-like [Capsicum annuum]
MAIQKWLLFVFLHVHLHHLILAQPPDLGFSECGVNGDYTENSTYKKNLNTLLTSLSSKLDKYGFYNASIGQNSDIVSVIVLCRGDLEMEKCRTCVSNIAQQIVKSCPKQKQALGGYEECIIKYSNRSIKDTQSIFSPYYYWSIKYASGSVEFNQELRKLLESLRVVAAADDRKYASGNATGPNFQTIYALVQCNPDLSPQDCSDCLTEAYGDMSDCPCNGKKGGRIFTNGCNFRFETYHFFREMTFKAPPAGKDNKTARTVIIIVVPIVIVVVLVVCISVILLKRRKRNLRNGSQSEGMRVDDLSTEESLQYDFSTIKAATTNFSNDNKLGQGGFGPVYKGELPTGTKIAVKRLSANSEQGDQEFKNEIKLVAKLQHRNLVRLLGFCLDGTEKILVYEFVKNASLDQFLFDPVKRKQLDWERRTKIIGGIAKGILYLHEDSILRIIHCDLKASNVLLDAEMNPKIADFGMARLFASDETHRRTRNVAGTYGYMAPEYAAHGQFSVKSDVFSFGVLVLEILSGQRNICFRKGEYVGNLLSYTWTNWREGRALNLIDPILRESAELADDILTRFIHIALLCVQENVADRPTMGQVVLMLSSCSLDLPVPSAPACSVHSDVSLEISLKECSNEVSMTESNSR